ncbi:MAG TPA: tetratricopeptide repeat protein [Myxococcaceae bacterium]|nr:tetratricopeptide repeat protein [Myxococcaceae bacterium]
MRRLLPPLLLLPALALAADPATLPITTSSPEARRLYLEGRDLGERLKGTEAHLRTDQAVKKDPQFALGWLQWAQTAGTAKEFFAGLEKALASAGHATEAEQKFIRAAEAGAKSRPEHQDALLAELAKQFPSDARIHNQIGIVAFGRQDWDAAIQELSRAVELEPKFTLPYNQLGYAYRFQGKLAEAEKTFQKYAELLPDDPNPLDSYAELLMRMGRFDESIGRYRKALQVDPLFLSAYVGIANDQIFLGKGDEARATLKQMLAKARTDGEKRQGWFWTAETYMHEEQWADAIRSLEEEKKVADAAGDVVSASQDVNFIGNLSLRAGKPTEAAQRFEESVKLVDRSKASDAVKDAAHRNHLFDMARVALLKGDLPGARASAAKYSAAVEAKKVPFEVRQSHELAGMIAVQAKDWDGALAELGKAGGQNPRVSYLTGLAWQGKGDAGKAAEAFREAADYNQLNGIYGFIRPQARRQLARS